MRTELHTAVSNADRVYAELRDRLLRGEVPLGQKLIEERLADEFATSRTPVREALRRLEGDGHLVRAPEGGLRPERAERDSRCRSSTRSGIAIEELSVRRAATAGDRAILEEVRAEWRAPALGGARARLRAGRRALPPAAGGGRRQRGRRALARRHQ